VSIRRIRRLSIKVSSARRASSVSSKASSCSWKLCEARASCRVDAVGAATGSWSRVRTRWSPFSWTTSHSTRDLSLPCVPCSGRPVGEVENSE